MVTASGLTVSETSEQKHHELKYTMILFSLKRVLGWLTQERESVKITESEIMAETRGGRSACLTIWTVVKWAGGMDFLLRFTESVKLGTTLSFLFGSQLLKKIINSLLSTKFLFVTKRKNHLTCWKPVNLQSCKPKSSFDISTFMLEILCVIINCWNKVIFNS